MKNVISQSLGLDLVNINVYATLYQNIPLSLRDRAIFIFFFRIWRSAKPRPMKNVISQSLGLDLVNKFVKIFHSFQEMGLFSLFQNLNLGKALANPKWHLTIPWATSCQYQCICKILSKYSKRFKSYRHFSRTGRGQNLHKQSKDKIFTNCPVTKSNVWL